MWKKINSLGKITAILLVFALVSSAFPNVIPMTTTAWAESPPALGDSGAEAGIANVIFTIDKGENGDTTVFLEPEQEYTDDTLLQGVSAVDENGDDVLVTVKSSGGVNADHPGGGIPFTITYAAIHPVTLTEFTATREAYVVISAVATMASSVDTWLALKNEINSAPIDGTLTEIAITDDIIFTGSILIQSGKNIKLVSNGSKKLTNTTDRHFIVAPGGTLILKNIVLDGGSSSGGIKMARSTLVLDGVTIQNCKASSGGGIYIDEGTVMIDNSSAIVDNLANGSGGGIFSTGGSTIRVKDGTIKSNTATNGGGIYGNSNVIVETNGIISWNTSSLYGGGIGSGNIQNGKSEIIVRGTVSHNSAPLGGGIYVQNGTAKIESGGFVSDNTAQQSGGGIFISNSVVTLETGSTVNGNTAPKGGGIHIWHGTLHVSGTISNNSASQDGGGVYCDRINNIGVAYVNIYDGGKVINNTAGSNGGGIGVLNSLELDKVSVASGVEFSGNAALQAYWMTDSADIALHNSKIGSATFSASPDASQPFLYAYNNYDISYTKAPTTRTVTVVNGLLSTGSATGRYGPGETVSVAANAPVQGMRFKEWTANSSVVFGNANSAATTFIMPAGNVTVTATYEPVPSSVNTVTIANGLANGSATGQYAEGETVSITANEPAQGMRFKEWTANTSVVFSNANSAATTFTMPAGDVTVTATYEVISGTVPTTYTNGSSSGGSSSGKVIVPIIERRPVTMPEAQAAYTAALKIAKDTGSNTVEPKLSDYYSEISLEILQTLAKNTKRDGMTAIRLTITVRKEFNLISRFILNPSEATDTVSLWAATDNPGAVNTETKLKRWFQNKFIVLSTKQKNNFGMPVNICVKPNLAGYNTTKLYFYYYDLKANTYKQIENPAYRMDANGYLHFTTQLGGEIVISEGQLKLK